MDNPLVSVVIPTYKRTDKLRNAIDSALRQTYSNLEILVVDDNNLSLYSTAVKEIVGGFDSGKVRLVSYEGNRNGAYARNRGIERSEGDYIAFLDDDDLWHPYKTEIQMAYLLKNRELFDAVYCKMENHKGKSLTYACGDLSLYILKNINILQTPSLIFRKTALDEIKGFDEHLLRHQDYDLLLRFFRRGFRIGFVNQYLAEQGPNDGENSLSGVRLDEMKTYFLDKFSDDISTFSRQEQNEIYLTNYMSVLLRSVKKMDLRIAIKYIFKCLRISPVQFITSFFKIVRSRL